MNDVMCFIYKRFIDSLVNEMGERNKSELSDIVVWFVPMTF